MFFAGKPLGRIFVNESTVLNMTARGAKFLAPQFLIMAFNIIASMYFTACGKAKESAIISSDRGIVILLITIYSQLSGVLTVYGLQVLSQKFADS